MQRVGKDSLSEYQKFTPEVARITRDDFWQRTVTRTVTPETHAQGRYGATKVMVCFHKAARKAISENNGESKVTGNEIATNMIKSRT